MKENFIINLDILVDNQTYSSNDYELGTYCGKIGLIIRDYYPSYYVNFIMFYYIMCVLTTQMKSVLTTHFPDLRTHIRYVLTTHLCPQNIH